MTAVKEKTGLAGLLDRITSVVRLVRPVDLPPPPYKTCAGCRQGGRDDQQVPDPDQYARKAKAVAKARADGQPEPKDTEIETIDAAPVWCAPCGAWYHAVKCYSLHHHKGWTPATSVTD